MDDARFQLQQAMEQVRNAARAVDAVSIHVKAAIDKLDQKQQAGDKEPDES